MFPSLARASRMRCCELRMASEAATQTITASTMAPTKANPFCDGEERIVTGGFV